LKPESTICGNTRLIVTELWTIGAFGGGEGMVLKPEPIFKAVESVRQAENVEVVALSAAGRPFNQAEALRLAKAQQVIVICGRYEGIDERVVEHLATAELSIGDYIISGGEIAAVVIIDAVSRYIPRVVGKEESILRDSFSDPEALTSMVEHPHYTRPADFRGWKVPEVLISGDHEAVKNGEPKHQSGRQAGTGLIY
jgi:tRNA (guanine37-N1)-methyltransferase